MLDFKPGAILLVTQGNWEVVLTAKHDTGTKSFWLLKPQGNRATTCDPATKAVVPEL